MNFIIVLNNYIKLNKNNNNKNKNNKKTIHKKIWKKINNYNNKLCNCSNKFYKMLINLVLNFTNIIKFLSKINSHI